MFPERFIASDSGSIRRGDRLTLIGVAIEFNNYSEFRNHYFKMIDRVINKYSLVRNLKVLKSEDLITYAYSYDLSVILEELCRNLINHDSVREIHICSTYLNEPVSTWKGEISPTEFSHKILSQYYPIVPIWRFYYDETRNLANHPSEIILDNIQGKITKAWKFLGKEYKIKIIPHGDITYPAISFCDLLCQCIKINQPDLYIGQIKNYVINLKEGESPYVTAEFIGNNHEDFEDIVTKLPYRLRSEQHYPHPILFIHGKQDNKKRFYNSDIFRETLSYFEEKGGCVTFFDESVHTGIFKKEDIFLYLDQDSLNDIKTIQEYNKLRKFKTYSVEELCEKIGL